MVGERIQNLMTRFQTRVQSMGVGQGQLVNRVRTFPTRIQTRVASLRTMTMRTTTTPPPAQNASQTGLLDTRFSAAQSGFRTPNGALGQTDAMSGFRIPT